MNSKNLIFYVMLSILISISGIARACHEEELNLRGHNPKWRFAGISVITESIFAFTSTTTGCDHYTSFIQNSYPQIAENAAKGEGEYLEAFALFRGCSKQNLEPFKAIMKNHYDELFLETDPQGKTFPLRFEVVIHRFPMLRQECGAFSDSSLS